MLWIPFFIIGSLMMDYYSDLKEMKIEKTSIIINYQDSININVMSTKSRSYVRGAIFFNGSLYQGITYNTKLVEDSIIRVYNLLQFS